MYSGNLINSLNAMAERAVERASEPGLLPAEKPDSLEIGSDHLQSAPAGPARIPHQKAEAGPELSRPELSNDRKMDMLLIRVRQAGPELFLADVKTHWADDLKLYGSRYPRDDYDWRAYYFLDQIQGCLLKGLDDTCCRPAADGRICRQMEGLHSRDGFCPTHDWYDATRRFMSMGQTYAIAVRNSEHAGNRQD